PVAGKDEGEHDAMNHGENSTANHSEKAGVNHSEHSEKASDNHSEHGATIGKTENGEHGEHGATAGKTGHHEHDPAELWTERYLALLSLTLAIVGISIGWLTFSKRPLLQMPRILENKWYVDELYKKAIISPLSSFSRESLWKVFDIGLIDGIVNGLGAFMMEFGDIVRRVQVGFVRSYAAFILFGALIVLAYFIYYGAKLVAASN
ncbi:MAG: hypothetical protein H7Z37_02250, partial [Pyrinomonadaceae bacterium]|nr:hypothetical protein [Pyrinomonadaceae bacterium]